MIDNKKETKIKVCKKERNKQRKKQRTIVSYMDWISAWMVEK